MLVSVIIPAYRAQSTLPRAVRSALGQMWHDLEVIVVADDALDYPALLQTAGIKDERLRFASTGRTGSGCHNARNVGLAVSQGNFIAALDADDVFLPSRLSVLLPLTQNHGAAVDNARVVDDASGNALYRAFDRPPHRLDIATLLDLSVPLFPLIARAYAEPRLPSIEFGEDFVANLRLIDRLGPLPAIDDVLFDYHVVTGSLSHNDKSAAHFEKSYSELIERLEGGDRLGLSSASALIARDGLIRKREFNRAFAKAQARNPQLKFQEFAAASR